MPKKLKDKNHQTNNSKKNNKTNKTNPKETKGTRKTPKGNQGNTPQSERKKRANDNNLNAKIATVGNAKFNWETENEEAPTVSLVYGKLSRTVPLVGNIQKNAVARIQTWKAVRENQIDIRNLKFSKSSYRAWKDRPNSAYNNLTHGVLFFVFCMFLFSKRIFFFSFF